LTIAVLEYVLGVYLRGELDAIPIWKMLRASQAELKARAESFAVRAGPGAVPTEVKSLIGGGSTPEAQIPSWGVALQFPELSAAQLEERLRRSTPPVLARVQDEKVILDFRTISETEDDALLKIVTAAGAVDDRPQSQN